MSADTALVAALRAEVLAALSERERDLAGQGRGALGAADEQALGRQLIAEALERRAKDALRDRAGLLSAAEERDRALHSGLVRRGADPGRVDHEPPRLGVFDERLVQAGIDLQLDSRLAIGDTHR